MSTDKHTFVSFEPVDEGFVGYFSIESAFDDEIDLQAALSQGVEAYVRSLAQMRAVLSEIRALRVSNKLIPARVMWRMGDAVFQLRDELASLSLQLDGLYRHLSRDLAVKRKWLVKVVTFRRYTEDVGLIPDALNWGRCKDGTKRVAQKLSQGFPPE